MSDPRHRRRVGFRKSQAAARQADYWRRRWQTHPETMRSNLEALNRTRREKAAERTQRLMQILSHCPEQVMSWELRPVMEAAIAKAGFTVKPGSFKTLMMALRRRSLVSFDNVALRWTLKSKVV